MIYDFYYRMKTTFLIISVLIFLDFAGCGNPPEPPVINNLLANNLTFNDSVADDTFFSIQADSISTIVIKDSIPSLAGGSSITFQTDHGTFLPSQGSSTLAAGSQSITVLAPSDTAQTLLVSGLDVVDTVIVTAGNGSSYTTGRARFTTSYPDIGGLLLSSSVYNLSSSVINGTLSITLFKSHGKVSNHFPIALQVLDSTNNNSALSLYLPQKIFVESRIITLPFYSNSIDIADSGFKIIASYNYNPTNMASDTIMIEVN